MDFHGIGDPTTVTNQLFRRCQEITNNSSRLSHLRGKVNGLMQGVGLSGCASPAGGLPGLPGPPSLPIIGIHEVNRWLFLDLMELLTNVDPTWNICSKCCRHLSTAYLVMWKLPETFSVTVDVVVNSSAWRYTFHGKWQKKWLLCERLEGEVSKWVSKIGGFQKEGSHLMILVSPISADLQRKPSNGSGFWYIFATFLARSWSLELRS